MVFGCNGIDFMFTFSHFSRHLSIIQEVVRGEMVASSLDTWSGQQSDGCICGGGSGGEGRGLYPG